MDHQFFWQRGLDSYNKKKFEDAIKNFNEIPTQENDFADFYQYRGCAKFQLGLFDESIIDFNKFIQLTPDNGKGYIHRAAAKYRLGRYEEAIIDYENALRIQPDSVEANENIGHSLWQLCKYEKAIEKFDEVIKVNPSCWSFRYRGDCKYRLGLYEESIIDFNNALRLQPDIVNAHLLKGSAKYQLDKYEEAIKDLNEAIRLEPNLSEGYYERGNCKFSLCLFMEAIQDYDSALLLQPDLVSAYDFRGTAKYKLCRYEEAIQDYDSALRLQPDLVKLYEYRGSAKYKLGRYEEAIKDFDQSINSGKAREVIYFYRGRSKKEIKEFDDSLSDFQMCKGKDLDEFLINSEIFQVNFYKANIEKINKSQFRGTSIINFPEIDFEELQEKHKYLINGTSIYDEANYSRDTKLNEDYDFLNWHVENFKDFYKLIQDLKNITLSSKYRTLDELIDLVEIIQNEGIDFFIVKNNPRKTNKGGEIGCYVSKHNYIYINSDFIFDIDRICNVLTHELIHYFQKGKPFDIEIEDSVVNTVLNLGRYKDFKGDDLQCELEAYTYENYPCFIPKYFNKKNLLKDDFAVPQNRLNTIKWICKNRVKPLHSHILSSVYKLEFPLINE